MHTLLHSKTATFPILEIFLRKNGNRDLFRDHKERAVHFQRMCETKSSWPVGIAKPTWVSIPFDLKKR